MLILQQTGDTQRWVRKLLLLKEPSDYFAPVDQILPVLLIVEVELPVEQVVLLHEDGDSALGAGQQVECLLDQLVGFLTRFTLTFIPEEFPQGEPGFHSVLDLCDKLEDLDDFFAGCVEHDTSTNQFDNN